MLQPFASHYFGCTILQQRYAFKCVHVTQTILVLKQASFASAASRLASRELRACPMKQAVRYFILHLPLRLDSVVTTGTRPYARCHSRHSAY